jgi:NhaP-type Na+/H+ or K+/H+ antiporter
MGTFLTETWNPLLELLGSLIRPLGGLVLGVVIGWIAAATMLDPDREWQLKIAIFLGLLGAFVTLNIYSGLGTTGFFALGVGVAGIVFGVRQMQPAKKK